MNIVEVRYFPKFGQILVRHFVKNGSDMGQIFVNFGQIFRLSTLLMQNLYDERCVDSLSVGQTLSDGHFCPKKYDIRKC